MEILRDETVILDKLDDKTRDTLINSSTYKYSNMQQMHSYKFAPTKSRHLYREQVFKTLIILVLMKNWI